MSNFSGYKTKAFSESQKFFVLDPNTGSPSFVNASDLVKQLAPNSNFVYSESTRTTAQATNYRVGSLVQTAGATTAGDNLASTMLVVAAGEGDFPMDNGNELLVIKGDDLLREQLAEDVSTGNGASLVNGATIYVGSVAELEALSLAEGVNVYLTEGGRGGPGVIKSGSHAVDPQKGIFIDLANGNYWERLDVNGTSYAEWFGYIADWDGSTGTDNYSAIQGALDFSRDNPEISQTVLLGPGAAAIESPINYRQGVNFFGAGTLAGSAGGTEIVCNFSAATISSPPTDNWTRRLAPVLDWSPMLYNAELLSQQNFGLIRFNGNNKDVYGIYINDFFYMQASPIFVINCNKAPFTGVVGQYNYFNMLSCNNNGGGVRFIGCDTVLVDLLDTEGNRIVGDSQLDIVQDLSTKVSVTINEWHYEENDTAYPDTLGRISGRHVSINGSSMAMNGSTPVKYLEIFGGAENYSFDSESFTAVGAVNFQMPRNSFSAATGKIRLASGAVGAYICTGNAADVVDNSGNLTSVVQPFTSAPNLPRGTLIKNSSGGNLMEFPSDTKVQLFNNANRFIDASAANMSVTNASGQLTLESGNSLLNLKAGSFVDIDANGMNAGRFDGDTVAGNTRFLVYDVDNGTLERVSVGAADSGGSGFKVLRIPN